VSAFPTVPREDEASRNIAPLGVFSDQRPRNRGLAGASQTTQPEDARRVSFISPAVYLSEKIDAGIGQAGWIVLSLVCVERRIVGEGQRVEHIVQVWLPLVLPRTL